MSDLIKREDAIGAVIEWYGCKPNDIEAFEKGFRIGVKKGASTNRPQGEWVESFKPMGLRTRFVHDGWSCSVCSEYVEKRYPNCPYCLAKMKGADDE